MEDFTEKLDDYINESSDKLLEPFKNILKPLIKSVITNSINELVRETELMPRLGNEGIKLKVFFSEDFLDKEFDLEEVLDFMIYAQAGKEMNFECEVENIDTLERLDSLFTKLAQMCRNTIEIQSGYLRDEQAALLQDKSIS